MPVLAKACCMPWMMAFTSRISCEVSIKSKSTPPRINPSACSWKTEASSSKVMLDSSGSFMEGSFPDGPIDPATYRGCPALEYSSASRRARAAAVLLMVVTCSDSPYSLKVRRFERNVQVSITSTPTSRKER